MATTHEQVRAAWESADRVGQLNRVVEGLAAEGVGRDALDDALGRLLDEVRAAGADDATEEIINSVGDRLHGWCYESRHITTVAPVVTPNGVHAPVSGSPSAAHPTNARP